MLTLSKVYCTNYGSNNFTLPGSNNQLENDTDEYILPQTTPFGYWSGSYYGKQTQLKENDYLDDLQNQ